MLSFCPPRGAVGFADRGLGIAIHMTIGSSIFLIAVGAILRYAVTASVSGLSLTTIGLILMLAGILGLVLSLLYLFVWRSRHVGPIEREPYDPPGPFVS
jgi:hypothetical protein